MNPVATFPAILGGLVLFLLPGLLFLALRTRQRPDEVPLDERLFIAVGLSVAVSSWVALVLAEDELARGVAAVKWLREERAQEECPIEAISERLGMLLGL